MVRTQVYIPDDQYNELKLMAAVGEGKFSDLIREGISEVIKKRKVKKVGSFDPWRDFIGKGGQGGPKDLSKNLYYYLYVEPYEEKKK